MSKEVSLNLTSLTLPEDKSSDNPKNENGGGGKQRIVLAGDAISPGFVRGKAFVYRDILTRNLQIYSIDKNKIKEELARIHFAMGRVREDLDEQKAFAKDQASSSSVSIFDFHKEVLKDKQLDIDFVEELGSELINAETVVKNVFRKMADRLRSSDSKVISAKADDLEDLGRRILHILVGYESNILEILPADSIIISKRLLPSDTVHLKRENLRGIVVEEGSNHSHSALLAREFGITAVANIKDVLTLIHTGDELLIDGEKGLVIVHPNEDDLKEYESKNRVFASRAAVIAINAKEAAVTKCGQSVRIYANAYSEKDFQIARENGCDGIGLFRLEQLYMSLKDLPKEAEIVDHLNSTFKCFQDKQITVRLLDVGGDKKLPYLDLKQETNSFLGLRGVRFLLKNPSILKTQLRAVLRLSELYSIRLLVPMITLSEEMKAIRTLLEECREEFRNEGKMFPDLPLGAMIETPAAVFAVQSIAEQADFLSIGTNDLLQYVMAAGRENVDVMEYYEKGVELILKVIKQVVDVGCDLKMDVSICGELAGEVRWTRELLRSGIRSFSISPRRIPELKHEIANTCL